MLDRQKNPANRLSFYGLPLDLAEKLLRFVTQQHEQITRQQEQIIQLQGQVEALEAEIHRLKKLPPKPDIKPNTKPPDEGTGTGQPEGDDDNDPDSNSPKRKVNKPGKRTRSQRRQPPIPLPEDSLPVAATDLPVGSTWNVYTPFQAQELTIQASCFQYLLEQWVTPELSREAWEDCMKE